MYNPEFKVGDKVEIYQGSYTPDQLMFKIGKVLGFVRNNEVAVEFNIPSKVLVEEKLTGDTQQVESPNTILAVSVSNIRKITTLNLNTR